MEALVHRFFILTLTLSFGLFACFWPRTASAALGSARSGVFEVSGMFSFDKNDYGDGNYEWTRKWSASLGYHLTEYSEIELSFEDVLDRTSIAGFEDTTFHDRIYSVDWVQAFTGRDFPLQPYGKLGLGQLNRDATGSYLGGVAPPLEYDQFTILVGAGCRVFFSHSFALRAEANTYLVGGSINTFNQNFSFNAGLSFFF